MERVKMMEKDHENTHGESNRLVCELLQAGMRKLREENKNYLIEERCKVLLTMQGINVRLVSAERSQENPSVVRRRNGKYSIGIPVDAHTREYAKAVYVVCREKIEPGFLKAYIKNSEILTEFPHRFEIKNIEDMFEKMIIQ